MKPVLTIIGVLAVLGAGAVLLSTVHRGDDDPAMQGQQAPSPGDTESRQQASGVLPPVSPAEDAPQGTKETAPSSSAFDPALEAEARAGVLPAQSALCEQAVNRGEGEAAAHWCEIAATAGDPQSQYRYARLLESGSLVPQDTEQAYLWYEKAAAQQHAAAQYVLGRKLFQQSERAEMERGLALLRGSAMQGHSGAKAFLRDIGESVPLVEKPKSLVMPAEPGA